MPNKHSDTAGWWAVPDDALAPPRRRDQCLDCGVDLGARTPRELASLSRAHALACPRRCVVHEEATRPGHLERYDAMNEALTTTPEALAPGGSA